MVVRRALDWLRRDDLARGAGINLLFTGGQALTGVLATLIAARYLGPAGVGIVAIGLLLAEFVSVLDNLPSQGFVRDHAHRAEPRHISTILVTKGALGLLSTLLLLGAAPVIARVFDVPIQIPLVFAFIPTASIVSSVALMAWEARRDMVRRNLTQFSEGVARLVLYSLVAFAVALPFAPTTSIAVMTLAASVVASIVGVVTAPRLTLRGFDAALARRWLSFGLRTQGTGVMQKTIFWFDILVIDLVLGHHLQGLYKTAYTLMAYVALASATVSIVMYPTLAHAHAAGDRDATRRALSRGWFYSIVIAVPFVVLFAAFPGPLLRVMMGAEFTEAAWMLRALAGVALLATALLPFEQFFPAIGRPGVGLRIAVAQTATNVTLNLILIPILGVAGAIVATVATFLVGLTAALYAMRRLGEPLPRLSDVRDALASPLAAPPVEES